MSEENTTNNLKLPVKASWIEGKKSKLLLDPYGVKMFLKEKKGTKAFYHCSSNKTKSCMVRLTLNLETDMIERLDGLHNHDSDLVAEAVKKIIDDKMETVADNPTVSPRSVMADITARVLNDPVASTGLPSIPKYNSLSKMVQRKRKIELDCPSLPKEWEEMIIPENMRTTHDNLPFVIMEKRLDDDSNKVIWGFSSPSGLDTMREAESIFADGTFEMVKQTLFSQIYVFVCPIGSISVPVAWFLLPNKEYSTYMKVLTCLKERGLKAPRQFHVDFEIAVMKAIRDVFPESKIIGCSVHFRRNIKKHLQDKGLLQHYMTDTEIQTFIRYIWAMTLVPPNMIIKVWEDFIIANQLEAEEEDNEEAVQFNLALDSLLKTVERVYIGAKGRHGSRKRPLFDHSIWNHHEYILEDVEETTNKSEAWNSASKHCMVMKPSIWQVLESLRKEEGLARSKIYAVAMGKWTDTNAGRTAKLNKRKESLRSVVEKFGTTSIKEWMAMVIGFYNDEL